MIFSLTNVTIFVANGGLFLCASHEIITSRFILSNTCSSCIELAGALRRDEEYELIFLTLGLKLFVEIEIIFC
jgi:hypothetical protein